MSDLSKVASELTMRVATLRAELVKKDDEIERLTELLSLPYPPNDGKTHFECCWKDRGHHNCAVSEIERLQKRIEQLERLLAEGVRRVDPSNSAIVEDDATKAWMGLAKAALKGDT